VKNKEDCQGAENVGNGATLCPEWHADEMEDEIKWMQKK
jgi:hypothetical protein